MKAITKILFLATALLAGTLTSCTDYQDEIDALDRRVTYLESLVRQANSEIEALQTIATAVEAGDYITNVTESAEGYIITFAKHGAIVIRDGVDGDDAQMPEITIVKDPEGNYIWYLNGQPILNEDGQPIRANGKDGKDGEDAVAPQVRINPTTFEWEYSINGGPWLSTGTKAQATDGIDGNKIVKNVIIDKERGTATFECGNMTFVVSITQ